MFLLNYIPPLAASLGDVRVAGLEKAAEKEGKVVFYGSIALAKGVAFVKKFQNKYPFLKVDLYRLNNPHARDLWHNEV